MILLRTRGGALRVPAIAPARRLCKQYNLFYLRKAQLRTDQRTDPSKLCSPDRRSTHKPLLQISLGANPFLFKKWVCAARRRRSFVLARGEQTRVPPQRKAPASIPTQGLSFTIDFYSFSRPSTLAHRSQSSVWWPGVPIFLLWFQQRGHFSPSAAATVTPTPSSSSLW